MALLAVLLFGCNGKPPGLTVEFVPERVGYRDFVKVKVTAPAGNAHEIALAKSKATAPPTGLSTAEKALLRESCSTTKDNPTCELTVLLGDLKPAKLTDLDTFSVPLNVARKGLFDHRSTEVLTYTRSNIILNIEGSLRCDSGLSCDLESAPGQLVYAVKSKTAEVTVVDPTGKLPKATSPAGGVAQLTFDAGKVFADYPVAFFNDAQREAGKDKGVISIAVEVRVGASPAVAGGVRVTAKELMTVLLKSAKSTGPFPAYASAPAANARRNIIVVSSMLGENSLSVHAQRDGSFDEVDVIVWMQPGQVETVSCGEYRGTGANRDKVWRLTATITSAQITAFQRATNAMIGKGIIRPTGNPCSEKTTGSMGIIPSAAAALAFASRL